MVAFLVFIEAAACTFLEFQGSLCVYGASKVTGVIPVPGISGHSN